MKWRKVTMPYLVLALSLTNTSCKMLELFPETKTIDYKSAGKLPPLDIPPDLIKPAVDERYSIPEIGSSGSTTFSSYYSERNGQPKAGTSPFVASSIQNIHIERAGTQRWLVIPQSPEAIWPIVKEFWQELGFLIKVEVPEAGIMETDWAENRAKIPQDVVRTLLSTFLDSIYSTAERDKFRTRLERNESGSTEVYISHRGMTEVLEGGNLNRTIWQPRPADPDLEAEMLSRLMMRFGVAEEKARQELTTSRSIAQERAYIDRETGSTLVVNEAFDRAWRRVGLALDRIGFTVEDRNRAEGIYFVRYLNPEKDSKKAGDDDGILSGIMFWRNNDKADAKAAKYRIQVDNTGTNTSKISLLHDDGTTVNSTTASRILNLLHEQLK
ncbi:outer membrane protein assembly factor BamC [Nitrosomonas sp. Nm166]|uniref:outer membrane protein assembly factor BamC n=1 Tax=Nitrosomonas sp. Nm166 TaxID=1881054 RepID=UPI0008EFAC41|nr:outer membrane protein assembly factor BamC [Nitrosomonas sp. Nm166]SFD89110.1 outer membrane protein assembly factor BamC [Nitrosomonas sp. Nm166]